METARPYFRGLDAIRFAAAMMVFFAHAVYPVFQSLQIHSEMLNRTINAACSGISGVSVFFVLSGFLITYLLFREKETTGAVSLKNFYARRILRIWPLYFLVLVIAFVAFPAILKMGGVTYQSPADPWYYFLFAGNFDVIRLKETAAPFSMLAQNITWSVAIEEQFYLFWPLLFIAGGKRAHLSVIIGTLVLSTVFRIIYHDRFFMIYLHTFSALTDLATGALFAWLIQYSVKFKKIMSEKGAPVFFVSIAFAFLLMMYRDSISEIPCGYALSGILYASAFGLVIVTQAAAASGDRHDLSKARFAVRWGKYTYGIYLIHPLVLLLVKYAFLLVQYEMTGFVPLLVYALVSLMLTLLFSRISYEMFEKRFINLKRRFAF